MLKPTLFILRLVLCTCFAAGTFAAERKEREKAPLPKPPPQPVEQAVKVRRGEAITIPLKIWGSQREPLQFLIRKQPSAGKLSEPKQNGKEAAFVEYESPASLEVKRDLFTYAVRNSAGVSAAVEVSIEIIDEPPMLGFPDTISFPPTLAGQAAVKEIEIENRGGGMAEGELTIDAPWKIEGPADYKLGAGERKTVMVVFSPDNGGMPRGEIRFSSDRTRTIALRGEALAPVAVEPASLQLQPVPGSPVRVGIFALTNNTGDVQTVQFAVNPKLKVEPSVELAPYGTAQVTLSTAPEAVGAIEETLEGRSGDAAVRIAVSAPPSAAVLQAVSGDVRFTAAGREGGVTVRNAGGKAGFWKWEVEAPFVPVEPGFQLAPGERKELKLRLAEGASGNSRTLLRIVGEGHTLQVAAEVNLMESGTESTRPVAKSDARRPHKSASGARPRNVAMERPKGPLVPSRVPGDVKVDKVERDRIVLSWAKKPGAEYRVEERTFVFKANGGEIQAQWQPVSNAAIREEGERAVAELKNLKAGQLYVLRVVDSANAGAETAALQVATPSRSSGPIFTVRRVILLGLFAALGALIWLRRRGA